MNSGYIYVISNASMGLFPNNSRSSFSNELPKIIRPKDTELNAIYLSLESFIMESTFVENATPNSIQIVCKNINPNINSAGNDFIIESIPMKLKTRILEYRPRLQKLYKICTNELKFPILEIRDENNKLVKFSTGFPTIVKLRISEMPRKMNHFFIRVACHDSKLIFSENNCSNFDVKLPKEVQVDSNWKVSLTSIFFPKNIHNIYLSINEITIKAYSESRVPKATIVSKLDLDKTYFSRIKPGYYESPGSLASAINLSLFKSPIRLHFEENSKRFFFALHSRDIDRNLLFDIKLSKKLLGILGFDPSLFLDDSEDDISLTFKYLTVYKDLHTLTCDSFASLSLSSNPNPSSRFLFPEAPNLSFSISPWVFVHSNMVHPAVIGDSRVPLLKIIPLNFSDPQRDHTVEFDNFEFSELSLFNFHSLHFEIRNHDGSFMSADNENLLLALLFQKFS